MVFPITGLERCMQVRTAWLGRLGRLFRARVLFGLTLGPKRKNRLKRNSQKDLKGHLGARRASQYEGGVQVCVWSISGVRFSRRAAWGRNTTGDSGLVSRSAVMSAVGTYTSTMIRSDTSQRM